MEERERGRSRRGAGAPAPSAVPSFRVRFHQSGVQLRTASNERSGGASSLHPFDRLSSREDRYKRSTLCARLSLSLRSSLLASLPIRRGFGEFEIHTRVISRGEKKKRKRKEIGKSRVEVRFGKDEGEHRRGREGRGT